MEKSPTVQGNNKLPSLSDLHHDADLAFKNDQLNLLLNQQPIAKWVKQHPFAKNVSYISIDKIEYLLTRIFQEWKAEVIGYCQLFNSVSCHVRLHYKNPISGEWSHHDGLGAVGVQTDKGATASDLSAIKQDAVMKALPAAKSYAIKDAAEHLGALFGRDLNRKDTIAFTPSYAAPEPVDNTEAINKLDACSSLVELQTAYLGLSKQLQKDATVIKLRDKLKTQLT